MDILFSKNGTPLIFSSKSAFGSTMGAPDTTLKEQKKKIIQTVDTKLDQDFTQISDGLRLLSWGKNNDFPQWADKIITSTSVLNSGLKFMRNFTLGQGLVACKVTDVDSDGNEVLIPYPNKEIQKLLDSRMIRRYQELSGRDYFKYGSAAVQLLPNATGDKIVGLNTLNAFFWRLTERDTQGRETCVISGKFPDTPGKGDFSTLNVLMDYDPETDLLIRKLDGKEKDSSVFMIRDS